MANVITVDNINAMTDEIDTLQRITTGKGQWVVAWEGQNYLNAGSTITCSFMGDWTQVDEVCLTFSAYDTETHTPIDGNSFQYHMSQEYLGRTGAYTGFMEHQNIAYPSSNAEGSTDWKDFFFVKSFRLATGRKIIGEGSTQINQSGNACVLRSVMVKRMVW